MSSHRTLTAAAVVATIAISAGAVLSGCTSVQDTTADGSSSVAQPVATESATGGAEGAPSTPSTGDYPTCDEVKAALGPAVSDLIELDTSENGIVDGAGGPELGCAWFTPDTSGSTIDVAEYGGISIGISYDPSYTEESMEPLGWTVQDPRVSAADAWALKVGGDYEPAAQLDATGVQVVREGTVVVLTSGGVALQDVPQLAALTNEWALGAGIDILQLTAE